MARMDSPLVLNLFEKLVQNLFARSKNLGWQLNQAMVKWREEHHEEHLDQYHGDLLEEHLEDGLALGGKPVWPVKNSSRVATRVGKNGSREQAPLCRLSGKIKI